MSKVHVEIADDDRAHYSKRTIDFEFEYPFGQKELSGLAYRTDFDLKNHKLDYIDGEKITCLPARQEEVIPHVVEPSFWYRSFSACSLAFPRTVKTKGRRDEESLFEI